MAGSAAAEEQDHKLDFDQIYADYFPFVWRSLRYLGVPPPQLDDAAQDVFLVAYRRLEEFERRSSIKTWLFGIAHFVMLTTRRRDRRKGGHQELPPSLPSRGSTPLEQLEASEAARWLEAFLATLDNDKRAVFMLAEMEQMTAPEISDALGVKLNTVYSRLRAARRALEQALERGRP